MPGGGERDAPAPRAGGGGIVIDVEKELELTPVVRPRDNADCAGLVPLWILVVDFPTRDAVATEIAEINGGKTTRLMKTWAGEARAIGAALETIRRNAMDELLRYTVTIPGFGRVIFIEEHAKAVEEILNSLRKKYAELDKEAAEIFNMIKFKRATLCPGISCRFNAKIYKFYVDENTAREFLERAILELRRQIKKFEEAIEKARQEKKRRSITREIRRLDKVKVLLSELERLLTR